MKIQLKLTLLWVFMMAFVCVQAQVITDFDELYAQELLKPGTYTLAVSVGRKDGKPEIMLSLAGGRAWRQGFW